MVPTAGSWVIVMLNEWKGNARRMQPAKRVTTRAIRRTAESPSTRLVSLPSNLMASRLRLWWGYPATYTSEHPHIPASRTNPYSTAMTMTTTETDHVSSHQAYKYSPVSSGLLRYPLIFICLQLPAIPFTVSMITRKKNKSARPGIPDMTPSQLASAGLSHIRSSRRPSNKKPTKDQQIEALKSELRAARELISSVIFLYRYLRLTSLKSIIF